MNKVGGTDPRTGPIADPAIQSKSGRDSLPKQTKRLDVARRSRSHPACDARQAGGARRHARPYGDWRFAALPGARDAHRRETTERPEAVEAGTARLVGTDRDRIVAETERLLHDAREYRSMAQACSPFGDGRAAEQIVKILIATL